MIYMDVAALKPEELELFDKIRSLKKGQLNITVEDGRILLMEDTGDCQYEDVLAQYELKRG